MTIRIENVTVLGTGVLGSQIAYQSLVDIAGLNTVYNIAAASDEQGKANARYIKEHYIDLGKLGRASGEGFYKYNTASRDPVRR